PGVHVYDCGLNHSGRPVLTVRGLAAGTRVRLRPAELLGEDGTIDQSSMTRWAEASTNIDFTYTAAGAPEERWEPAFTYVGYRYLQLEGIAPAQVADLASDFLTDDFPQAGEFSCTDERLNRIHGLIRQAVLSNAASCLTDCPTREKIGWLEQTYLNADAVLMNIDAAPLYEKIAADIGDAQLASGMVPSFAPEYQRFVDAGEVDANLRNIPEWGSAVVLAPWAAYRLYGNRETLASSYPAMQRYAAYILTRVRPDGLVAFGIGDWYDFGPNPPGVAQLTSLEMTCTATLRHMFACLAQVASLLGQPDADGYRRQSEAFRAAILARLYDPKTHQFDRGSQAANAMALALDLAPEADRQAVLDNLVADIHARTDHVSAGDVGFPYVVRALSMHGRGDVLLAMLQRNDKPSYGEQLAHGATALTEAWDGERVSSQNHFMLGHIETWFYRGLGGIDVDLGPDAAHEIVIAPDWHCGVQGAKVVYHAVFGRIASDWSMVGGRWRLAVEIPAGKRALVRLPEGRSELVGSGRHAFSHARQPPVTLAQAGGRGARAGAVRAGLGSPPARG
ncbi:MAG: family 78 glycoside hydrolase catalytic domain, partial [Asticcacaulis sp.]|nr:family 78 glycoside hydrolase catalytic domain [Asticcacaulis sp.]